MYGFAKMLVSIVTIFSGIAYLLKLYQNAWTLYAQTTSPIDGAPPMLLRKCTFHAKD